MDCTQLSTTWPLEKIFNSLDQHGFALIEDAYPTTFLSQVRHECISHLAEFREAAIQNGVMSKIRSDHILWIDDTLDIATQHTKNLLQFGQAFNHEFYSTIREIEAHFASYQSGEFYALHRDNPQQKNNRILSSVFYMHESWQPAWGGQLHLQDKNSQWHIIEPNPNRLVLFYSDLLHEVLPATQQRLSITAWLRSQDQPW